MSSTKTEGKGKSKTQRYNFLIIRTQGIVFEVNISRDE